MLLKSSYGLAGGDWNVISEMIERIIPQDVYVYEL